MGRTKGAFGICTAPFDGFPSVTGDLPSCIGETIRPTGSELGFNHNPGRRDFEDDHYMAEVRELNERATAVALEAPEVSFGLQMQQFWLFLNHKLGYPQDQVDTTNYDRLMAARAEFEENRLRAEVVLYDLGDGRLFVREFNNLTLKFQNDVAEVLDGQTYYDLLNLPPDERIVLSDPDIVGDLDGPTGEAT